MAKVKTDNEDQAAGVKIVVRALEQPMREIARNAGDEPYAGVTNFKNPASAGFFLVRPAGRT